MKNFFLPFGLTPNPKDDNETRYADMYTRSVAGAIDVAILYLMLDDLFRWLTVKVYAPLDPAQLEAIRNAKTGSEALHLAVAAHVPQIWIFNTLTQIAIIGAIYVTVQCIWFTTPGKALLGIKIVKSGSLEKPSRFQFVLRYVGYLVSAAPLMLGMIWASFNKEHRCWHDYIARTVVIHTRPRLWLWKLFKQHFFAKKDSALVE